MDAVLGKLDSAARQALTEKPAEESVPILVRVTGVAAAVRSELEQAGLELHSMTGPVVTGRIKMSQLKGLAALATVRRIELGRALHNERP